MDEAEGPAPRLNEAGRAGRAGREERERRLAAAMRDNLKRRKAQARGRTAVEQEVRETGRNDDS